MNGKSIPYLTSQLKCIRSFFSNHGITHALTDFTESKLGTYTTEQKSENQKTTYAFYFPPPSSPSTAKYHYHTQSVFPNFFPGFRL